MKNSPPSSGPTVLAVDAGSTSVRAALFDLNGACIGFWQQSCGQTADSSAVEQDPLAVLAAVKMCLDNVALVGKVRAAAIVSQGASAVCFRRSDGTPLSPVISWQDRRGERFLAELSLSAAEVHARTGLPLSCHYGATKLRWCLEQLPEVAEAQTAGDLVAGPLMSLLLYHLCLERPAAVDAGSASRTQLWNLNSMSWDAELARELAIPTDVLPVGRGTCSLFGTLAVGGQRVPVVFANRDQQAALFADGRPEPDVAYVNLGTGGFIQSLIANPTGPPDMLINRVLSGNGVPPLFSLEGTVHGAAGGLPWLDRYLGFAVVPQMLDDALVYEPPFDKDVYFVNGLMGMGSPYWRSETIAEFSVGLMAQEKLLAWMESVVFMLIENLRIIQRHTLVERLSVSGGFSNLSGLIQRLADLSGLECRRRADHEATLRGAAYVAAGQPDSWQPAQSQVFLPATNHSLEQRFARWRDAMRELFE